MGALCVHLTLAEAEYRMLDPLCVLFCPSVDVTHKRQLQIRRSNRVSFRRSNIARLRPPHAARDPHARLVLGLT